MTFSFRMKPHRYFQLIGMYGALFLIPVLQYQINYYSGNEESAQRTQVNEVVRDIYYMNKRLICTLLGQEFTAQQCKKGIYQNSSLGRAVNDEQSSGTNKNDALSKFWIIYAIFAGAAFLGNIIEYTKEYENERKVSQDKKINRATKLRRITQLVHLYNSAHLTRDEYSSARFKVWFSE
ncbi:TPA: hypothetical protein P0E23_005299 [Vibrio harveyi]|uniref:hypothetical protein n=1 Tax=Vibrio sp. SSH13-20 TaxID=3136668 RepID=UPI0032C43C92|nr:hypothetical protein [Vibrio harveyi]